MATTRRQFLTATTGAVAGWTLADTNSLAWASRLAPRVRKDVATLTNSSPEIVALTKAVDQMDWEPTIDAAGKHKRPSTAIGKPFANANIETGTFSPGIVPIYFSSKRLCVN